MFNYNELHYQLVAQTRRHDKLAEHLGEEELFNHISTVFYTNGVEIHVGKSLSCQTQANLKSWLIFTVAGLTPKFPISNPSASDSENAKYVEEFTEKLEKLNIDFYHAYGRARDFKAGSAGCFLLFNVMPEQVKDLLKDNDGNPTQLSFTFSTLEGEGELISCID